jgi:hypothetical protein
MLPLSGRSSRLMQRARVDLPAPLGPTTAVMELPTRCAHGGIGRGEGDMIAIDDLHKSYRTADGRLHVTFSSTDAAVRASRR